MSHGTHCTQSNSVQPGNQNIKCRGIVSAAGRRERPADQRGAYRVLTSSWLSQSTGRNQQRG